MGLFHDGAGAAGHAPRSVRTRARVQPRNIDRAPTLARIDPDTEGGVPGIDEQRFQSRAEEAKANRPVSRALPELALAAQLASA